MRLCQYKKRVKLLLIYSISIVKVLGCIPEVQILLLTPMFRFKISYFSIDAKGSNQIHLLNDLPGESFALYLHHNVITIMLNMANKENFHKAILIYVIFPLMLWNLLSQLINLLLNLQTAKHISFWSFEFLNRQTDELTEGWTDRITWWHIELLSKLKINSKLYI